MKKVELPFQHYVFIFLQWAWLFSNMIMMFDCHNITAKELPMYVFLKFSINRLNGLGR